MSFYHILVCLILIAVFSQILKFRLDFISVSVVGCTMYTIWYISSILIIGVIISRISLAVVVYII